MGRWTNYASQRVFAGIAPAINKLGFCETDASSVAVKMLSAICQGHGFDNGEVGLQALVELKPTILSKLTTGDELPGFTRRRRDLLLPGWAIMAGLMQACSVDSVSFSVSALRQGMLDFMVKNKNIFSAMQSSKLPAVGLATN